MNFNAGDKIRRQMKDGTVYRGVYLEPMPPKNIITGLDLSTIRVVECGLIQHTDGKPYVWTMSGWERDE